VTDYEWLNKAAIETFNEKTLAGLALAIVRDGRLERFIGLGLADIDTDRPVEPETVFRIGSISKTMTAIGVLQLVEEGKLGLDDPVNNHLRKLRVEPPRLDAPPVTVRHLLSHSAGIGELRRWSDVFRPVIALGAKAGQPLPTLTDYYGATLRAEVPAGTKWAYANHGFGILGYLIEDVCGEPFVEVMRRRIFEPLGMERTDFLRSERVRDSLAVGYAMRGRRLKPVTDREIVVAPAGSCFSSVADMARYVAALAGHDHPLLQRETFEQMLAPQGKADVEMPAMGLGFFLERIGGHRVVGHDGGWSGFVSSMLLAPDDGVGVLVFTNTSVASAPHELGERVLRRLIDVPERGELLVPERPHIWPELTGVYKLPRGLNTNLRWWPLTGGEIEITVRRGHLTARAPSPLRALRKGVRLRAADRDDALIFEARHGDLAAPVVFERDPDGDVNSLRTGSTLGGFLRLERRPRVASLRLWGRALGAATLSTGAVAVVARKRAGRQSGTSERVS
jgi:CubicO group peptidase (beta-lactamase class C family)